MAQTFERQVVDLPSRVALLMCFIQLDCPVTVPMT